MDPDTDTATRTAPQQQTGDHPGATFSPPQQKNKSPMQHPTVFKLEFYNGTWFVLCPTDESVKFPVDSAIIDTLKARPGYVEGYIVAVHGLDLELAQHLDRATLYTLGVAAQIRRNPPPLRGLIRIQLMPDGQFDRQGNR